jgi:hypothetical protein
MFFRINRRLPLDPDTFTRFSSWDGTGGHTIPRRMPDATMANTVTGNHRGTLVITLLIYANLRLGLRGGAEEVP